MNEVYKFYIPQLNSSYPFSVGCQCTTNW